MPKPNETPSTEGGKENGQGTDSTPKTDQGDSTPSIKNENVGEQKTYTQEEMHQIAKQARLDGEKRMEKRLNEEKELTQEGERVKEINQLLEDNSDIVSGLKDEFVDRMKKADPEKVKAVFDNIRGGQKAVNKDKGQEGGNNKDGEDSDGSGDPDDGNLQPLGGTGDGNFNKLDPKTKKIAEGISQFQDSGFSNFDALSDSIEL